MNKNFKNNFYIRSVQRPWQNSRNTEGIQQALFKISLSVIFLLSCFLKIILISNTPAAERKTKIAPLNHVDRSTFSRT